MDTRRSFYIPTHVVFGSIIIILGVLFTLDNIGALSSHDYLRFWPVLIILYALTLIAQPRATHSRPGGFIWLLVGVALLIDRLGIWEVRLWDYWPLLLVLIGFFIIRRSGTRPDRAGTDSSQSADSTVDGFALLSSVRRTCNSKEFKGGNLTSIWGGIELDLRTASISSGPAIVDVFALWGGIDIIVPRDWTVIVKGTPILGGFEDKTEQQPGELPKHLVVSGIVIMGGADIKN